MGQDNITIDKTYFKLPGDNNSDGEGTSDNSHSSDNYMDFNTPPPYKKTSDQLREYLDMMEMMEELKRREENKQEQSSPVEDEELDEDLEDNVQNGDEPSGEGSWESGNNSLENVPSERFSVGKKLRDFFN
jgi:hypothetical protein